MLDQVLSFFGALADQTGLAQFWWGNVVMIAVGAAMILLAVLKHYEPLLLVGIGFSCIITNVPGSDLVLPGGLFHYAYEGVQLLNLPPLIFFGVGAMTDFGPMIANPKLVILGVPAHLLIFVALIGAKLLGFTIYVAGAIGIIGGADGPMAIFMTVKLRAASAAADLGCCLFLHGADAGDAAAGDEAADQQAGTHDPHEADAPRSRAPNESASPSSSA